MLPHTHTTSSPGPAHHRQSNTLDQNEQTMGSAQGEAGPSGSSKSVRGNMYAMSKGTFAGSSIRHSLELLQEPVSGRRRTEKDRRPLTHCPILRLRVFKCHQSHSGDWTEEEADVSSFESSNYVCAADLQPHTSSMSASGPVAPTVAPRPRHPEMYSILNEDITDIPPQPSSSRNPVPSPTRQTISAPVRSFAGRPSSYHPDSSPPRGAPLHRPHSYAPPYLAIPYATPVQRTHDELSPENDDTAAQQAQQQTKRHKPVEEHERNLFGALHLPTLRLPAPSGELGMWFLFSDLTVQLEGTYILRFRVYDLSTIEGYSGQPVQPLVEILSSPFTVFSPRTFPGMPNPTPLTDHFTSLGFKLNTKKNEKQARAGPSRSHSRKAVPERPAPVPLQAEPPAPHSQPGMISSSTERSDASTSSVLLSSAVGSSKDFRSSSSSEPTSTTNSTSTVRSISSVSNMSNLPSGPGGGSSSRLESTLGKVEEAEVPTSGIDGDVEMEDPQR